MVTYMLAFLDKQTYVFAYVSLSRLYGKRSNKLIWCIGLIMRMRMGYKLIRI